MTLTTGEDFNDDILGQMIGVADGMLTAEWEAGYLCLSQSSGNNNVAAKQDAGALSELKMPHLASMQQRLAQFEAKVVALTEQLACNRVPRQQLPQQPRSRVLARQASFCLQPCCLPHMQAWQRAKEELREIELWRMVVRGAKSACHVLCQFFLLRRRVQVSEDEIVKILLTHRSRVRHSSPLTTEEDARAALAHLLTRAAGWLIIKVVGRSTGRRCAAFQAKRENSAEETVSTLQRELDALAHRHDRASTCVKHAYMSMIPGSDKSMTTSVACSPPAEENGTAAVILPLQIDGDQTLRRWLRPREM
jgi:hypothetical protein